MQSFIVKLFHKPGSRVEVLLEKEIRFGALRRPRTQFRVCERDRITGKRQSNVWYDEYEQAVGEYATRVGGRLDS